MSEVMADNRPYLVHKRYTCSLHEKSGLCKDLEAWRGKPFTPEELLGFDLENLLGKPCMLSVIHVERNGSTYANVSGVMKSPRGIPTLNVRDYVRVVDREPAEQRSSGIGNGSEDEGPSPHWADDEVPF